MCDEMQHNSLQSQCLFSVENLSFDALSFLQLSPMSPILDIIFYVYGKCNHSNMFVSTKNNQYINKTVD